MTQFNIQIFTGRSEFDEGIKSRLGDELVGFGINLDTEGMTNDGVVTLPEYLTLFTGTPTLLLSDSLDSIAAHEDVVEFSPFPITEDDLARLEFRLIAMVSELRDATELQ